MRLRSMSLVAAFGLLGLAAPTWATDVTPGSNVTPSTMSNPLTDPGFTVVASTSGTFSTPVEHGTYSAYVVRETSGTLDFVYQFGNDASSQSKLERMTAYNFAGFKTNVGYVAGTGDDAPFTADRTSDGKVVGFNFLAPRSVSPGDNTDIMVIKTDATNFTTGTYTFQDGGATTVAAYSPALPAPEPSSLLSLGLGGIVVLGIARRRKSAIAPSKA